MTLPLSEFRIERPQDLAAAVQLGARDGSQYLAGGTDLITNLRHGHGAPSLLVDLTGIAELEGISCGADGARIGANARLASLCAADALLARYAAIGAAAAGIAGPGHRNLATLGGNLCLDTRCVYYNQSEWWRAANHYCLKLGGDTCHVAPQGKRCHAAFCSDLAPVLLALHAEAELLSPGGARRTPLAAMYRDDGAAHLTLARDEILTAVHVPAPPAGLRLGFRKSRVRGAMDFPLASVAVALTLGPDAAAPLASLAVGISGTNSHPLHLQGTEALVGRPLDDAGLAALGKLVQKQVSPMRSTVTSSNHRRVVAAVLAQRLLRELAAA